MSRPLDPLDAMNYGLVRAQGSFTRYSESLHGPQHWWTVFCNARSLAHAAGVPRALNPSISRGSPMEFLCWFAMLHDCGRTNDDNDPHHGERGCAYACELFDSGVIQLPKSTAAELFRAIRHHSDGQLSDHPLTAICWDADRLELPRVGIRPDPRYMSTAEGIARARTAARAARPLPLNWSAL